MSESLSDHAECIGHREPCVLSAMIDEVSKAEATYGPYVSTHEAFGVLAEEMAELLAAIQANTLRSVQEEALQVAAVAYRLAVCCEEALAGTKPAFRERSGG